MEEKKRTPFVGYDYKEVTVPSEQASLYKDCYESFGWEIDENPSTQQSIGLTKIKMKRDRKIINKMELIRLQQHFETCAREIEDLERSKHTSASIWALVVGTIGTVYMAGSVFAVTHTPPIYWLCVLLAVPAFAGWLCPFFLFRYKVRVQTRKVQPLIESKYDEIYEICKKAYSLL